MLIPRLVLFAVLVLPIALQAQTKQIPPKSGKLNEAVIKDEGESFLGIPIAEPFPGSLAPCPVRSRVTLPDHDAIKAMSEPCYFQRAPNKFEIFNGPDLSIGHSLNLITYKGYPAQFVLTIARARFPQMTKVFSARYGEAHRTEVVPAYTRAGETFQFQSLRWTGRKITVLLDEGGSGDVRWSTALVTSRLAEALRDADKERAAEAAASQL